MPLHYKDRKEEVQSPPKTPMIDPSCTQYMTSLGVGLTMASRCKVFDDAAAGYTCRGRTSKI